MLPSDSSLKLAMVARIVSPIVGPFDESSSIEEELQDPVGRLGKKGYLTFAMLGY